MEPEVDLALVDALARLRLDGLRLGVDLRVRDAHLRRLLAGSLVPAPRAAADELPVRRPSSL